MYYYIFEPASGSMQKRLQRKIKDLVGEVGIAGETVSPSPARSIDELAQIGSSKGYSTVVAVGSDLFFNKVASSLINQFKKDERKIVMGIVPLDLENSLLSKIAGLKNLRHAIDTLKYRRLEQINLGLIEPNKHFLTPLKIKSPKKINLRLKTADFDTNLEVTDAEINKDLVIKTVDASYKKNVITQTWNWLMGKQNINPTWSVFRHQHFIIETPNPLPVFLESETIAKTPIAVSYGLKPLHLIVSRGKLNS